MPASATVERIVALLEHLSEQLATAQGPRPAFGELSWQPGDALRLLHDGQSVRLSRVANPALMALEDLLAVERQKQALTDNTERFVAGLPANHALLWGARGTGKSSLVRALWTAYRDQGLTLLETDKRGLTALPELIDRLQNNGERLLVYCDDLSFEADDPSYKPLKSALEGSIATPGERVLIYATSNRRHLLPEVHADNADSRLVNGELHHGEAVEEKVSLSDRFGLWLSFHALTQDQYLRIAAHWLQRLGEPPLDEHTRADALRWALGRGGRSGRVAWQFARNQVGR